MVLFFARDAGAANVLAAVYPAYAGEKIFWAKDYARSFLDRQGIAFQDFNALVADRPLGLEDGPLVSAWVRESGPPATVVTGATHWDDLTDRLIWEACTRKEIPTICFLDGWIRPLERFRTKEGLFRPDCIAAMDPAQARLLEKGGLARERVVALGHPHLSRIHSRREELRARRGEIREKAAQLLGRSFEELIVLVSEPQSILAQAQAQFSDQEFNEVETYEMVRGALDRIGNQGKVLAVKLHPKEDGSSWRNTGAPLIRDEIDGPELAAAADAVVGVKSMLLIEAAILGTPVICLEKFTRPWERLVTNDLGLSHPVKGEEDLARLLAGLKDLKRPTPEKVEKGLGLGGEYLKACLDLIEEYAKRRAA